MNNPNPNEATQSERCKECKTLIKPPNQRYFCCDRKQSVCQNCSKNTCKSCGKKRENKIQYLQCCYTKCKRIYDRQDMFYDFKGQYYVCPKCLRKDYEYYYKLAQKNSKEPEDVKIFTNSTYPYQDLVHYFRNWCFSCANRIGQQDAYEMIRGPRICSNCAALNFDKIHLMIRCILCQGYMHTLKQIFSTYGIENEVICIYCAQKNKELQQKVDVKVKPSKQTNASKISNGNSSVIKSALRLSKSNSKDADQIKQPVKKSKPASKISSINSVEFQVEDMPLNIKREKANTPCSICNSFFDQSNLFFIKRTDQNQVRSILKLIEQQKQDLKLCPLCFGDQIEDRGQTIQFDSPPTRNIRIEDENMKQPEINYPKISIAKQGASQNVFKLNN